MSYKYFSHNGNLLPVEQAVVPLSNLEYSYGYGVYETIRVTRSMPYFIDQHCQRLLKSASVIELEHPFSADFVKDAVLSLIQKNKVESANVKILLVGGVTSDKAELYALCLNPQYIERKFYRDGVSCITYRYEREFPQAKTLNMLPSYLAYRKARTAGAYDSLLVDASGNIREGTRTNFFGLKVKTLFSPPSDLILPGVMRANLINVADRHGYDYVEQPIELSSLSSFDSCFLTSASSKILPISRVDQQPLDVSSSGLRELMQLFDQFLDNYLPASSQFS